MGGFAFVQDGTSDALLNAPTPTNKKISVLLFLFHVFVERGERM